MLIVLSVISFPLVFPKAISSLLSTLEEKLLYTDLFEGSVLIPHWILVFFFLLLLLFCLFVFCFSRQAFSVTLGPAAISVQTLSGFYAFPMCFFSLVLKGPSVSS